MTKYCITGATGGLGSRVLHHLLNTLNVPLSSMIVSLHNPSGLPASFCGHGLDVRQGDFTKPETLKSAFKGADKLLIVSYPSIAHGVRVNAHKTAINAAVAEGVKHIYYTSLTFAGDSSAAVMQAHVDTEAYLKSCGVPYTIIREGIYSESYSLYLGFFDAVKQMNPKYRMVTIPGDGGIAWVARDDLGEGTARMMVHEGYVYKNGTFLLSGAEAISLKEVGSIISNTLNWDPPLRVNVVGEEQYIDAQLNQRSAELARGFSGSSNDPRTREFLKQWSSTYPALEKGECAVVDPLLQDLLGRKLKSMRETIEEELMDVESAGVAIGQYAR